jgi:flagellar biosynthesis GTPase FlhF
MAKLTAKFTKEAEDRVHTGNDDKLTADDDKLVEIFKIEDETAQEHGIETEHFLLLRKEYAEQEEKERKETNPQEEDTVQ